LRRVIAPTRTRLSWAEDIDDDRVRTDPPQHSRQGLPHVVNITSTAVRPVAVRPEMVSAAVLAAYALLAGPRR